jgi:hypothetical protein
MIGDNELFGDEIALRAHASTVWPTPPFHVHKFTPSALAFKSYGNQTAPLPAKSPTRACFSICV